MRSQCSSARLELAALAGRELDLVQARRLWAHLGGCRLCLREYTVWLRQRGRLADLASADADAAWVPQADEAFFSQLRRDIETQVETAAANGSDEAPRRWSRWVAAAAALLLMPALWWGLLGDGAGDGNVGERLLNGDPVASVARSQPAAVPAASGRAPSAVSTQVLGNGVWPESPITLSHRQGLEGQRQLLILFEQASRSKAHRESSPR
ncbi:MAG: hypothetical protein AAF628_00475 [Planctomycetota bacterium]